MSDDEARKRILERRAQFIRAAITSAGIGSASVALNACDNPLARPCLEPPPATTTKPPTAQPCLEPMPPPADAGAADAAAPNPSVTPNPSTAPSASANSGAPPDGSSAASAAKQNPTPPLTAPTQTVVKPPPMPCLKPVAPPKSR